MYTASSRICGRKGSQLNKERATRNLLVQEFRSEVEVVRPVHRAEIDECFREARRIAERLEDAVESDERLDRVLKRLRTVMQDLMVSGVKYEQIAGAEYEMYLFEQQDIESYLSRTVEVRKSIYDVIECESSVERRFAESSTPAPISDCS